MPKYIKSRDKVKNIKILDKSVNLSTRMKDGFIRTKEKAEETQSSNHTSPTDYATEKAESTTQETAQQTALYFSNPGQKARKNLDRAKGHFQEVKRQMPGERKRAAEQAKNTAQKAKSNAVKLRKNADEAGNAAQKAKKAAREAKQKLMKTRQAGRQTIRDAKQSAKIKPDSVTPRSTSTSNTPATRGSLSPRPSYSNAAPKGTAKTLDSTVKTVKSTKRGFKETAKGTVKTAKKSVKTAEKSAKSAVKTAQQAAKTAQKTAQATAKAAKVAERTARAAAKAAVQTAKAAVKAVAAMVKIAISAIKGLIALIAAGGWTVVLIILIICLIGLLVGSIFGIFFSSEPSPDTGKTINMVIAEIDGEYMDKVDDIIASNPHDLLDMSGAKAGWKEVLAVYTVKTTGDPDNPMEVATIDDEKEALLRSVFWEMNIITHTLDTVSVEEDVIGEDGLPTGETVAVSKTVLRIVVSHKTPPEMAAHYSFTEEQVSQLEELLKPEYHSIWNALLYGITTIGDGSMIEVAITQLGNVGGESYWRWYGFTSRVEWCACFVSWCAEVCGYIEAGIIPKFAGCVTGSQWFMARDLWQDRDYTPHIGDIIFFDWEGDGVTDHVGIVESVADGKVNTIEGNSSDSCRRRSYELGSSKIYGYGVPAY